MKLHALFGLLLLGVGQVAFAFDTEKASDARFQVAYVEPVTPPDLSVLPSYYGNRAMALADEAAALRRGVSADVDYVRKLHLRAAVYPIRVTDRESGIVYEVRNDRRTITATRPTGEVIWTVDPFVDARLKPYRMEHPVIVYFGPSAGRDNRKGPFLAVTFNSSQFGVLDLATGKFDFAGQD